MTWETESQHHAGHIQESPASGVLGPFHSSSPEPATSREKPVPLTGPWREGPHISLKDLSPDLVTMGYSPSVGPPALLLQQEPVSSSWRHVVGGPAVCSSLASGELVNSPGCVFNSIKWVEDSRCLVGLQGQRTLGCPSLGHESRQGDRFRERSQPLPLTPWWTLSLHVPPSEIRPWCRGQPRPR